MWQRPLFWDIYNISFAVKVCTHKYFINSASEKWVVSLCMTFYNFHHGFQKVITYHWQYCLSMNGNIKLSPLKKIHLSNENICVNLYSTSIQNQFNKYDNTAYQPSHGGVTIEQIPIMMILVHSKYLLFLKWFHHLHSKWVYALLTKCW